MAYTIETYDAWSKGEGEEGYDYQTVADLIAVICETALGRVYVDASGYLVYESRLVRAE